MADKNVNKLVPLFYDQSKFVHMSGAWKQKKSSNHEDWTYLVQESRGSRCAVKVVDDTAILWSRITLTAFVRGDDVVTESTVNEVFKKEGNDWKVLALTFSSVRDKHQIKH